MGRPSKPIILIDNLTGERLEFRSQTEAADHINKVVGTKLTAANIYLAIQKKHQLGWGRFSFQEINQPIINKGKNIEAVEYKPFIRTRTKIRDGWEFTCFWFTPNVIIADRRLLWYDEDRLQQIKKTLRKNKCYFAWNEAADNDSPETKHTTRVEVYMLVDKYLPFERKISQIMEIIDRYDIK